MILKHFHFWCQRVLPLVYDDSLSYYEVLCKVVFYINQLIDDGKMLAEEVEKLREEIAFIKDLNIEELKRIIEEAKALLSSVTYTSSIPNEVDAATALNTAIGNGVKTIYIDSDIELNTPVNLRSGVSVIGAGGVIHTADSSAYLITGSGYETLKTTVSGYVSQGNDVTAGVPEGAITIIVANASGFEVGKRYKIVGTQNLFKLDTVGEVGYLGNGTSRGTDNVYGVTEFVCKNINGNRITMDRETPYYIGSSALVYEASDIENVTIKDVAIIGPRFLIGFNYCNNVKIINCNINATGGQHPIGLTHCYDCEISGNNISSKALAGDNSYTHNTIVLASAGDCKISGNNITGGSQNIDITYNQRYSYRNHITNNIIIGATDDSLTTHPAALKTLISNNTCSGNISVRSKNNIIVSNVVSGYVSTGGKCCDGTVISRNTILSSSPIRVSYASDNDVIDSVFIVGNICPRANELIRGSVYSVRYSATPVDTIHECLNLFVTDNITNKGSDVSVYCFYLTGYDSLRVSTDPDVDDDIFSPQTNVVIPPPIKTLIFSRNTFSGYTTTRIFRNAPNTDNLIIQDNTFNSANLYLKYTQGEIGGNPLILGNSLHFRDGLPADSTNGHFGTGFPPSAAKGDVYTKQDGTVGVYIGNDEWITLAHAE